MRQIYLFFALFLGTGYLGWGQVNITAGSTLSENFSIGAAATATLPPGWKADKNSTARTVGSFATAGSATELRAGNSMSATAGNGIYNFGAGDATTSAERSVGGLSSGSSSKSVNIYLHLLNNGSNPISDFTISYAAEKYREGTNTAGFSIQMYYSMDGNSWITAGPDFLTSFPGADPTSNGYAIAPGMTSNVTGKTLPVSLLPGANLYIAWNYSVTSGTTTTNAQALGIDDVTITATGSAIQGTYTWNQTGNAAWSLATNWTPNRVSPQANDILKFVNGASCIITDVPSETVGQLILTNNTSVSLQSAVPVALIVGGIAGTDLDVQAGCNLNLNGTHPIVLSLGTGATGIIGGNMFFSPASASAHRLTALDPGSVIFNYGAIFTAGINASGDPFGTTSLGSVIFTNGSTFIHQGGNNPFGASQPNSVVVFQAGSSYKVTSDVTLSFSGRSYANFELDAAGVILSPSGETPVSIDNLTVTHGTLNFNLTGTNSHSIKGNIYVAEGATLNFDPVSEGTLTLNGSCTQSISGSGSITTLSNSILEIANSNGVDLNQDMTMNGKLKLTVGLFTIGSSDLTLTASSAIMGTPCASAMIVATGTGQVKKEFSGPGNFLYPVGDHTETAEYSPVTLTFTNGNFEPGNYAGVNLVNDKYPDDPNNVNYLKRYWSLNSNGIQAFSGNVLFQYLPADVVGTENDIYCVKVDPVPFAAYNPANAILHELTAAGLTGLGTFTGSAAAPNLFTVSGSGSYCQGGAGLIVTLSGSQVNVNYQLKKNGIDNGAPVAGTGSSITWINQLAGTYTVAGINTTGSTNMNGSAIIEEIPSSPVSVSIAANFNPVCTGTTVDFTATTVNGGTTPTYQWKVNGIDAGTNSPGFSYVPLNNDAVFCILISNISCPSGNPATSDQIVMTVSPILPVNITIAPSANPVCPNTPVTFTAAPVNGGSNPQYQWTVNGSNVGINAPTYSYNISGNDAVTCMLTSNLQCTQSNPATSGTVNMVVNEFLPVSVSITASSNPVCVGTSVTFTATPVNGGTNPSFQWKVNNINVGTNSPLYTYEPSNNDHITCTLISNLPCVSCNPATSATYIMTVNAGATMKTNATDTVGAGMDTSFSATEVINVAGGESTFVVQSDGWATMFAGENILLMPGTKVEQGGYMHGSIATSGLNCGVLSPSFITVIDDIPGNVIEKNSFIVYPNPNSGFFSLERKGAKKLTNVSVELSGIHGESLLKTELSDETRHEFSISNAPPGLYLLRIFTGESIETIKINKH